MTGITLDREQLQTRVTNYIMVATKTILMALALVGAASLLKWAMDTKLAQPGIANSSPITAEVRERQLTCLARNIYNEAGSEPFEGKVAVAQVTLNRAASGQFPQDICQVIYQKNIIYGKVICQFSWFCDRVTGPKPVNKANYDESMVAAKKVLLEEFRLPSLTDALYYHADYVNPRWRKVKVAKIGRHIFYK